ncbi:NAD(P)/FAD-dependent oxidoreductase [Nocardia nova]|uniref:NAD(P)/FAD-dependent oxidoreductase n=1 Tax=Nocardia nova TaxID=37330 RepID=UPI000CE9D603|nr:FAD-dependent oxidoreductase [Nocardia nova]PPJ24698.1 FAD-dependent oxidoreductase [Nocardia nova]
MSTEQQTFVIVGGGLAGATAAESLRTQGFPGRIVLLCEESERPYNRPPLSKDYLQGKSEKDKIYVHPQTWYAEHDVALRLSTGATGLDLAAHRVSVAGGERIGYDKLLLCTGSVARRLSVPGAELDGVFCLRRLEQCEAIKAAFAAADRVAIIGGGWIGLETAAAARAAGCEVTVIERGELPLLRVLGREMAEIYADLHRAHGVALRSGVTVAEITGDGGRANGVRLADGSVIEADAVVVGVGISPDTELAEAAGLHVDNGIVVDERLATSDPDVVAAGDVANAYYPHLGTHLRLEHWSAALNQPAVAAATMLGRDAVYDHVPYFYSDQYEMGMEYSGYVANGDYDEVVFRGDVKKGEYVAFWLRHGRVLAGMNVNVWDVTDTIAALVRTGGPVDRDTLADPAVPLAEVTTVPVARS